MSEIAAALSGADNLYAALAGLAKRRGEADLLAAAYEALAGDAETLARLRAVDNGLLRAVVAVARGQRAAPELGGYLAGLPMAPIVAGLHTAPSVAVLTNGEQPGMPDFADRRWDAWFEATGATWGFGSYGELRSCYASDQFADAASPERRTRHLGIDIYAKVMTPLYAPLPGRVATVAYNSLPLDYGHLLVLAHDAPHGPFWTLYGHLAGTLPGLLREGQEVAAGQLIGHMGDWHENGGWGAHVHFQLMASMLEQRGDTFFGVGHKSLWAVWEQVCPDPNLILRLPAGAFIADTAVL